MALEASVEIDGETSSRVALTDTALDLLRKLQAQHGPLMFHQSGGCCDGSSPMCYPRGEFLTGDSDILLGTFHPDGQEDDGAAGSGAAAGSGLASGSDPHSGHAGHADGDIEFWMSREQFEYWKHTHLTVDVVNGRGGGFSVEAPEGKRFLIRSKLIDAAGE